MRALLICPGLELQQQFTAAVAQHPSIAITKTLDDYPSHDRLRQHVCVGAPEIVFLNIEESSAADRIVAQLETDYPSIQRIALHRSQDPAVFRRVLQLRMRELLTPPFDPYELNAIFTRLQEELHAHPATIGATDRVYAFLPAKAGSGGSTIAANSTWAFSQTPETRVLLADFDTSSGVTGFLLNVEHEYGLKDLAQQNREIDLDTWDRVVKKLGSIDVLLSGAPQIEEMISGKQLARLFEFARRTYNVINADLPDALTPTSLAVLREANQIFLVATPELPSLRMARLKAMLFQKLELQEKVSLLVNRASKRTEFAPKEIEKIVGLPVLASFPCDYANVSKAIQAGQPATKLSEAALDFVGKLTNQSRRPPQRKRFIENFTVVPLRYGFR